MDKADEDGNDGRLLGLVVLLLREPFRYQRRLSYIETSD